MLRALPVIHANSRGIDHDLGGLDDGGRLVTPPELQLVDGVPRNDCGQLLVTDAESHLREEAFAPHFLHDARQPVAAAQRHEHAARQP